jgi:hypothetical protein
LGDDVKQELTRRMTDEAKRVGMGALPERAP